jgi:ubiquinone biosynthesis protein UbiJ
MLYAVKGNKQLKIDEAEKTAYLNLGYDIAEYDGEKLEIIAHSPAKTITYAEYKKLLDENAELKKKLEKLEKASKK